MQKIIFEKAKELVRLLSKHGMTVTFAESCTGGLCASHLTSVSGASGIFKGSVVTYSESIKEKLVNVSKETLEKHTVYSEKCALEMSFGAKNLMDADMAISLTGIAGPSGATENAPVGTVYISLICKGTHYCRRFVFDGDREHVRQSAVLAAYDMAIDYLCEHKSQ